MRPVLHAEIVTFCVLPPDASTASVAAIGTFHEAEGTTVIVIAEVRAEPAVTVSP